MKRVNIGKITAMLDHKFQTNILRAQELRESKRKEEEEAAMRKIANKAVRFNKALEETLASTIGDLTGTYESNGECSGCVQRLLKTPI